LTIDIRYLFGVATRSGLFESQFTEKVCPGEVGASNVKLTGNLSLERARESQLQRRFCVLLVAFKGIIGIDESNISPPSCKKGISALLVEIELLYGKDGQ
jgi:hypothetical protein